MVVETQDVFMALTGSFLLPFYKDLVMVWEGTLSLLLCVAAIIVVMTSFYAGRGQLDIYNQVYYHSYKSQHLVWNIMDR